jgi:hypothetical protein
MSTTLASKATASSSDGNVTVTKPSGLSVGDLMIAGVSAQTSSDAANDWNTPTNWTELVGLGAGSNEPLMSVFAKIADSSDVAASNFAFTSAGTTDNAIGTLFRITGTNGFASIAINIRSSGATNGSPTTTPSISGVTTIADNSLLLIITSAEKTDGDIDYSAYAVANSNPTWTEEYDINNEPSGIANNMAVASAQYATAGATGNVTVTTNESTQHALALIAITENINATTSPAVISVATSVQAPTVTGGAAVSPAVISVATSVIDPTVTTPADTWSKQSKNSTTWTTQDKS